jgi:C-terminal processing protease CtpA/Prc
MDCSSSIIKKTDTMFFLHIHSIHTIRKVSNIKEEYKMRKDSKRRILVIISAFMLLMLACSTLTVLPQTNQAASTPTLTSTPAPTPTSLPQIAIQPGTSNPNEPVFITGKIPYTSPFFLDSISEPFVMLEDEAGFVRRDHQFEFPIASQQLGPVIVQKDKTLTYDLALPAVPQGTFVDVDNNGKTDTGVQVFAVAYWSNTWDGPFLEKRDGTGWSNAYSSTITDPNNHYEITGGKLLVWAPDDQQSFPTGFGADGKIFTADDPTAPIPAGYNIVDLDQSPFKIYKQARPEITLVEGPGALNDYSKMSFSEAFEALFSKASREYPFTTEKNVNWQALHDQFAPRIAKASNQVDFYQVMHDFSLSIPDGHIGITPDPDAFFKQDGGSFGLILAELSDGRVIVTDVLPNSPGEQAGIKAGAVISSWNNQPIGQAIDQVVPYFSPYSTEQAKRLDQVIFLTRVPPGTRIPVTFTSPGSNQAKDVMLTAVPEYDSLIKAIPDFHQDKLVLPIESKTLEGSGLGYIRITTFEDDFNLLARLWERAIKNAIDNKVPGLIIDLRTNGGGSSDLAFNFAGYFFDETINLYRDMYYNEKSGQFEYTDTPTTIDPAPLLYDGPIAVLVSPRCVSACEGFSLALKQGGRSIIVGNSPTAGAYGSVGLGQYKLPGDLDFQIPTTKSVSPDGKPVIEGVGVPLDITVPVTEASALGQDDSVLQAAIQALLAKIK